MGKQAFYEDGRRRPLALTLEQRPEEVKEQVLGFWRQSVTGRRNVGARVYIQGPARRPAGPQAGARRKASTGRCQVAARDARSPAPAGRGGD